MAPAEVIPLCLYPGQGFAEMVHHRTTVKSCCKDADTGEAESVGARVQAPPDVRAWKVLPIYRVMNDNLESSCVIERSFNRTRSRKLVNCMPNKRFFRWLTLISCTIVADWAFQPWRMISIRVVRNLTSRHRFTHVKPRHAVTASEECVETYAAHTASS